MELMDQSPVTFVPFGHSLAISRIMQTRKGGAAVSREALSQEMIGVG